MGSASCTDCTAVCSGLFVLFAWAWTLFSSLAMKVWTVLLWMLIPPRTCSLPGRFAVTCLIWLKCTGTGSRQVPASASVTSMLPSVAAQKLMLWKPLGFPATVAKKLLLAMHETLSDPDKIRCCGFRNVKLAFGRDRCSAITCQILWRGSVSQTLICLIKPPVVALVISLNLLQLRSHQRTHPSSVHNNCLQDGLLLGSLVREK